METFTNKQISDITGLSPVQIQFYTKEGVVIPAAGGGKRGQTYRYSKKDLIDFGIIRELLTYGMTIQKIREIVADFRKPAHGIMDRYTGGIIDSRRGVRKNAFLIFYSRSNHESFEIYYNPNGEESFIKENLSEEIIRNFDSFLVVNIGRIIASIEAKT